MLKPGSETRVHLALGVTDMRKSFDTLAALVQEAIGEDPLSGHLFAFCNRRRDRMKILYWDQTGYCLLAKRLERGRFSWPNARGEEGAVEMTHEELNQLLSCGVEMRAESRGWYDWHAPKPTRSSRLPPAGTETRSPFTRTS